MNRSSLSRFILLSFILLVAGAFSAKAQNTDYKRFEVRLGVSGYPMLSSSFRNTNKYVESPYSYLYLEDLYYDRDGVIYTFGNIGSEFTWNIKKWLAVCAGLHVTPFWRDRYDGYTRQRKSRSSSADLSGVVMVRFNYFNRQYVHLYSSIGAGLLLYDWHVAPQIQLVPLGVSFGGRVFGFAELGAGTLFLGGNIGIGYQF